MIDDSRIKELALGLFKQESDRDRQKKVGASDFSDPCEYHLAKKLLGEPAGEFKYWLGAKIGTATHEFLEKRIESADLEQFPEWESAIVEQSIVLGELENYGVIKSKPDLVLVDGKHLVDWKTSKRDKSRHLQEVVYGLGKTTKVYAEAEYSLKKYYAQAQIYAWGLNRSGVEIDACSLVFINRDGTYDPDVWTYTFPYSEEFAQAMWDRLVSIWSRLQAGETADAFAKEPECFNCKVFEENNA
jgi:hypothetical protein